jgi:hypothetical protein
VSAPKNAPPRSAASDKGWNTPTTLTVGTTFT